MAVFETAQLSIRLHDLGCIKNGQSARSSYSPSVPRKLVFLARSIEQANDEDNRILREILGIKSIINTTYPTKLRYYRDDKDARSYRSEACRVERVLGITSCHVHLRLGGAFAEGLLKELPAFSRQKLNLKASMATDRKDPKLIGHAHGLLRARNIVDDSIAALEASASVVAYVFNSVLAAPKAFPLLLCGDGEPGNSDSLVLLFLLLVLLDISGPEIERVFTQIEEELSTSQAPHAKEKQAKPTEQAAHQLYWTTSLRGHLDAKYGGVAGYLSSAGVTEAAKQGIRAALLPSDSDEKNGPLLDLES